MSILFVSNCHSSTNEQRRTLWRSHAQSKSHVWSIDDHKLHMRALQRLPLTRDLSPSKESDKVAFWWTSIKEKPLELFLNLYNIPRQLGKKLRI